jgi:hypothetical protein
MEPYRTRRRVAELSGFEKVLAKEGLGQYMLSFATNKRGKLGAPVRLTCKGIEESAPDLCDNTTSRDDIYGSLRLYNWAEDKLSWDPMGHNFQSTLCQMEHFYYAHLNGFGKKLDLPFPRGILKSFALTLLEARLYDDISYRIGRDIPEAVLQHPMVSIHDIDKPFFRGLIDGGHMAKIRKLVSSTRRINALECVIIDDQQHLMVDNAQLEELARLLRLEDEQSYLIRSAVAANVRRALDMGGYSPDEPIPLFADLIDEGIRPLESQVKAGNIPALEVFYEKGHRIPLRILQFYAASIPILEFVLRSGTVIAEADLLQFLVSYGRISITGYRYLQEEHKKRYGYYCAMKEILPTLRFEYFRDYPYAPFPLDLARVLVKEEDCIVDTQFLARHLNWMSITLSDLKTMVKEFGLCPSDINMATMPIQDRITPDNIEVFAYLMQGGGNLFGHVKDAPLFIMLKLEEFCKILKKEGYEWDAEVPDVEDTHDRVWYECSPKKWQLLGERFSTVYVFKLFRRAQIWYDDL